MITSFPALVIIGTISIILKPKDVDTQFPLTAVTE